MTVIAIIPNLETNSIGDYVRAAIELLNRPENSYSGVDLVSLTFNRNSTVDVELDYLD